MLAGVARGKSALRRSGPPLYYEELGIRLQTAYFAKVLYTGRIVLLLLGLFQAKFIL